VAESYYLKLMGFPELRRADGRPVKLKVRKHLALLIYFVVDAREVYYRDELAELLWPEVPEENSRHSLSMACSVLRGLFGSTCITGNHAEIRFRSPEIRMDLDQLECGEILGSEVTPMLEVDAFLRDFQIEDAPDFQHWRDRRNAQFLPMMQAGLLMLTDQARRSGDMARLLALADRLLALDSLAEEGIRARMEALAMQGDRVGALRVFEAWKSELSAELGAQPSEILEGIAARLRQRGIPAAPAAALSAARSERPFVGRTAEYRALFEAWESTLQLHTTHVLLSGESGIGKSTLAMRFASAAALEGAAVARVQCFELEQRIAFGMIGALVTSLLSHPAVMGTAPESLAEVARVIPAVRQRFSHLPCPRQTEGEAARLQFAEGAFALLDAIMEEQPLVLIVDDYPRSDEASLSVLHMLLRRAANDRLMVILSGRPPEPDEPPQAARIRKGISYLPLRRVELAPLNDNDSDALIHNLLSTVNKEPGTPERRAILRTAGGNPMALELLTQDWISHGEAALAILLPAMGDVPGSALEAIGYDRLIERIVPALVPRTRLALYLAAILGPRLNDLEYFGIIGFTAPQTLAALSELLQSRVLRETPKGLEFVNELIRARLYLKIPVAVRTKLHNGVADRLLAEASTGGTIPGLEIAWHCRRARRSEEATPYLMSGARDAITHGAPDEAARALMSALGNLKGRAKAEASLLLAETYQEMGKWGDALACIPEITQEYNNDEYVRDMADILRVESETHLDIHPLDELPLQVRSLTLRCLESRESAIRARAAFAAASIAGMLRRQDLLLSVTEALGNVKLEELDPSDATRVLVARAMAHYHAREKESGRNAVLSAAALSESTGIMDSTFVQIQTGWGAISLAEGHYSDGIRQLEVAYNAAARLDNTQLMAQAAVNLSLCYYRLGMPDQELKWAVTCWEKGVGITKGSYNRTHAAARCAFAHLSNADHQGAKIWLKRLQELGQTSELEWVRQAAKLYEADIYWLMGQKLVALSVVERICSVEHQALSIGFVGPMARWTAVSAIMSGEVTKARYLLREWYDRLEEFDALDQAEVLCGLWNVEGHLGCVESGLREQARDILRRLPIQCSKQLQQLGLRLPN
jgi:DNA-binding SARP family transcriptional activator/tetratricopeptide (TPR) repeat protein